MTLFQIEAANLLAAAEQAAYAASRPKTKLPVGSAVLMHSGNIITGVSIESSAYPASTCAEHVALLNALSQDQLDIKAIAVFSPYGDLSPCGNCRQLIAEFGEEILVIFQWQGEIQQQTVKSLLPFSSVQRLCVA